MGISARQKTYPLSVHWRKLIPSLRPVTWPCLQKSQRCTSSASDMVPTDRETPMGSVPRVFRPMCELLHTVSANQTCNSTILLLGTRPACAECAETADNWCSTRADWRSAFGGNPPALSGLGHAAARLDSEQFRSAQKNSGLPQGLAHPLGSRLSVRQRPYGCWVVTPGVRGKVRHEAPRVHCAARQRRRVATRGERAADAEAADHRGPEPDDGFG